jgi:hypothetical protein
LKYQCVALGAPLRNPNIDVAILLLAGFEYTRNAVEKKVVQRIVRERGNPMIVGTLVGYNKYKSCIVEELSKDLPVFTSLISRVRIKALTNLCDYWIRRHRSNR